MAKELSALQAVRLKGRTAVDAVATSSGTTESEAAEILQQFVKAGLCQEAAGRYRLTVAGREALADLVAVERQSLDAGLLHELYEVFVPLNSEYKELIHAWQVRGDGPNDHRDADYDRAIFDRVYDLHARFEPVLAHIVATAPRLTPYTGRFTHALDRLRDGDTTWLARPIMDSHHTVWFELHEDLIGLAGHTRLAEATAGRAA